MLLKQDLFLLIVLIEYVYYKCLLIWYAFSTTNSFMAICTPLHLHASSCMPNLFHKCHTTTSTWIPSLVSRRGFWREVKGVHRIYAYARSICWKENKFCEYFEVNNGWIIIFYTANWLKPTICIKANKIIQKIKKILPPEDKRKIEYWKLISVKNLNTTSTLYTSMHPSTILCQLTPSENNCVILQQTQYHDLPKHLKKTSVHFFYYDHIWVQTIVNTAGSIVRKTTTPLGWGPATAYKILLSLAEIWKTMCRRPK